MKISKTRRGGHQGLNRSSAKLADFSPILNLVDRLLLRNRRWVETATVTKLDGGAHFIKEGDDVLVHVETEPEGISLWAKLGTTAGGAGTGVWMIPTVGTEVTVSVPRGRIDYMPTIVSVGASGVVHARLQEGRTLVVGQTEGDLQIVVGDTVLRIQNGEIQLGEGATEKAVKGDLLKIAYDAHFHPSAMGPTGPPAPLSPTTLSDLVKVK